MSTLARKYVAWQTSPAVAKMFYVLQWILLVSWIPVTLYGLFFSPIAPLHDAVHPARHGVMMVPCH